MTRKTPRLDGVALTRRGLVAGALAAPAIIPATSLAQAALPPCR